LAIAGDPSNANDLSAADLEGNSFRVRAVRIVLPE
jgi:hypothetical protein